VTAGMVEEFDHVWGAKLKDHVLLLTSRLRKVWGQLALLEEHAERETETIRNVEPEASRVPYRTREYQSYVKLEAQLSHQLCEILGVLPQRTQPSDHGAAKNPITDYDVLVMDADGNLHPVQ
jgi:hypothetical protein